MAQIYLKYYLLVVGGKKCTIALPYPTIAYNHYASSLSVYGVFYTSGSIASVCVFRHNPHFGTRVRQILLLLVPSVKRRVYPWNSLVFSSSYIPLLALNSSCPSFVLC